MSNSRVLPGLVTALTVALTLVAVVAGLRGVASARAASARAHVDDLPSRPLRPMP